MAEYWAACLPSPDTMSAIGPKLKSLLADARAFLVLDPVLDAQQRLSPSGA
jgi:hypothetical protein